MSWSTAVLPRASSCPVQAPQLSPVGYQHDPCRMKMAHWWLGSASETRRAVELGCYFSVNHAMASRPQVDMMPHDRLLLETDHPSGDRHSPGLRRPGATQATEVDVARRIGITEEQLRERQWHNLS